MIFGGTGVGEGEIYKEKEDNGKEERISLLNYIKADINSN